MIWVVGAKGMLGQEMTRALTEANLEWVGSDREVDFTDYSSIQGFSQANFPAVKPLSWIVNCAAYTAVDKAEDEPELCRKLNVEGPGNLGRLANERGARVLHISTDYVFSGDGIPGPDGKLRAYREDDSVGPQGIYGQTKADGEASLIKANPQALIVRTAWLYGVSGPNFVYTMLRLMKIKDSLGVVADQYGSPTWAKDLVGVIIALITKPEVPRGIYHFSGEGTTDWHQFALEIMKLGREYGILEKDIPLNPLSTAQYPTKASRPAWSVLDKTKIKTTLGREIPQWQESLRGFFQKHLSEIKEKLA